MIVMNSFYDEYYLEKEYIYYDESQYTHIATFSDLPMSAQLSQYYLFTSTDEDIESNKKNSVLEETEG